MEIPEFNRHRIRTQLVKIIAHIHEARSQLGLCERHSKFIRNADNIEGIATLQLNLNSLCHSIDQLHALLTRQIVSVTDCIGELTKAMDNPNNTAPPIRGRFLALTDRTPLQRILIKEGYLPYSDLPTHFGQVPKDQNNRQRKCRRKNFPQPPKPKPRKPKRKDMPL